MDCAPATLLMTKIRMIMSDSEHDTDLTFLDI